MSVVGGPRFAQISTLWNDLLAYYTADNTPNDALGTYNGTLVNGTTYGTGIINQGFKFDGVNDYVNLGPILDFDGSTPFSFSFWIKPNIVTNQLIIEKWTGDNKGYIIFLTGGKLRFALSNIIFVNALRVETINVLSTNLQHITISYDGSKTPNGIKIYINNIEQSLTTLDNSLTGSISHPNENLTFGLAQSGLSYYNGILDEVGVWDKVLTPTEVTELYNAGAGKQYPTGINSFWNGVLSYFKANNTAYDEVAGYTGTLNNGTTYDTGIIDSAFSFDSSLIQSITTTSPSHNYATDTTYNMWIKPSSLPGFCMFLHIPSGTQGPGIGLRPGGELTFFRASVNLDAKSGIFLNTNVWQMITIVYRSGGVNNVDFYVNGSLLSTKSLSVGATGGGNMYIGSNGASNGVYNGLIDEVSIWNSTISPSKITELYNSGSGKQYPN